VRHLLADEAVTTTTGRTITMTRILAVLFTTLFASAVATAVTALPAQADPGPAPRACAVGYVCVNPPTGAPILIPEGQGREFPGGIKASIANRTKLDYCVGGQLNFSLAPGATVTEIRQIRSVGPQPTGGACLH
jgi:hypothetical protein